MRSHVDRVSYVAEAEFVRTMKDEGKYETSSNYVKELEFPDNDHYHRERKATEIIELGRGQCNVTTDFNSTESFPSQRNSNNTFYGVIFRLAAKQNLDLLTIEFDAETGRRGGFNDSGIPVEVYTRLGGFRTTYSSPDGWTLIANTTAMPTPYSRGNIIPVQEFQRITMRQREERSFYINSPTGAVIYAGVREGDLFGRIYAENDHLENIVGYAMDEPTFNGTAATRLFHGFIHYQTTVPCEEADNVLDVDFTWYVDAYDASRPLIDVANEYVNAAILDAMRNDARFIRYQNFFGLNFLGAQSRGYEHTGTCPFGWDLCTRIVTNAQMQHLPTMNVPQLHIDVLRLWSDVDTPDNSPFQLGYYGPVGIVVDYWITLDGVADFVQMDDVMIQYFEDTTTRFLQEATDGAVMGVQVVRQIEIVSRRRRTTDEEQHPQQQQPLFLERELDDTDTTEMDDATTPGPNTTNTTTIITTTPETNTTDPDTINGANTTTANPDTTDTNTTATLGNTTTNSTAAANTTSSETNNGTRPSNIFESQLPLPTRESFSDVRVKIYGMYRPRSPPESPDSHRNVGINQVRNILQSAFLTHEADYVAALRRGVYEPGRISEPGRFEYFSDIESITTRMIPESLQLPPTRAPTMPPSNTTAPTPEELPDREVHGLPYNIVFGMSIFFFVVGGLFCLILICCHCKNCMDEKNRLGMMERRARQKMDKLRREQDRRARRKAGELDVSHSDYHDLSHSEFQDDDIL